MTSVSECLIIAAGKGERLSARGSPKPLISLLGMPLIERVIATVQQCGIKSIVVVTGHESDKMHKFLNGVSGRRNIPIHVMYNNEWQKGNGISVLAAQDRFSGPFFLLMADHLFDKDIMRQMRTQRLGGDEVLVGVDYSLEKNQNVDIHDVTKVWVDDAGKIRDIGKDIRTFNSFDTGIFLCSPAVFGAVEKSISQENDDSHTGAVQVLSKEGKVRAFDIGARFWIDIDDTRALHAAESHLLKELTKSSDGPVSRYFNRPLSTRISRLLVRTRITPNQISVFSFFLSGIAAFLFSFGSAPALISGGIIAQLASVVDGCDGEIARLKHKESDFGKWFDAVLDRYADALLIIGLTVASFLLRQDMLTMLVGFGALIGSFMTSYTILKYDDVFTHRPHARWYFRTGRDIRILIIALGAILLQPFWALVVLTVLMNGEAIRRIIALSRISQ